MTVQGLRELDKALGELTAGAAKGVLRRVGRKALEPVDAAWRSKAPRDKGTLAASGGIGAKLSRRQRKQHKRESTVEVFAGPGPLAEATQQEFGNENHPPQPFLRPAWDETQDLVLEVVASELGGEIDKAAKRAARRALRAKAKGS
ncbi:HK97-gp10 family putative phage morphogenesis protein [Phenylobacterium sp.]|uniref:HK97-gp10 family putative phage morphogenesis protein n=1 Tax=Phenylobacterium sp. TaxID=1871053 RepID=UPI00391B5711